MHWTVAHAEPGSGYKEEDTEIAGIAIYIFLRVYLRGGNFMGAPY